MDFGSILNYGQKDKIVTISVISFMYTFLVRLYRNSDPFCPFARMPETKTVKDEHCTGSGCSLVFF